MVMSKEGNKSRAGLSKGEIAAMKEALKERNAKNDESAVLAKIAQMKEPDRTMAKKIHALIKANAPSLSPKTWYGMPAYAKDDKIICFFKPGQKFKMRYADFGFSDKAHLDDGRMWPDSFALKELTAKEEARIVELVKKAIG